MLHEQIVHGYHLPAFANIGREKPNFTTKPKWFQTQSVINNRRSFALDQSNQA